MVGHGWVDTLSIAPLSPAVTQVVAQTLLYCLDVATVVSVVLLFKVCSFITLRYCPCKTLFNDAQYCRKRMYRIEYCQVCSAVLQVVTSCLICGIWGRSHSLHTHAPCPALCAAYFIKYLMNICTACF